MTGGRRGAMTDGDPRSGTVNIRLHGTLVHFVAHLLFQEIYSLTTATSCPLLDRTNEMRSFRTIVRCCSLVRPQRSRSSQLYGRVPYNWDAYNRILTVQYTTRAMHRESAPLCAKGGGATSGAIHAPGVGQAQTTSRKNTARTGHSVPDTSRSTRQSILYDSRRRWHHKGKSLQPLADIEVPL